VELIKLRLRTRSGALHRCAQLVSALMKRVNIRNARLRRVVVRITAPVLRRDMTIWLGANAGRRINATHSQLGAVLGTTEPEMQRRFTELLKPGQVLFDVGANSASSRSWVQPSSAGRGTSMRLTLCRATPTPFDTTLR
jgi:hypothetical protein